MDTNSVLPTIPRLLDRTAAWSGVVWLRGHWANRPEVMYGVPTTGALSARSQGITGALLNVLVSVIVGASNGHRDRLSARTRVWREEILPFKVLF